MSYDDLTIRGTYCYFAPEIYKAYNLKTKINTTEPVSSDRYAFGLIIIEMLMVGN